MYRSFLLQVWTDLGGGVRASLTEVETGEAQAFADLEALGRWLELATHRSLEADGGWARPDADGS